MRSVAEDDEKSNRLADRLRGTKRKSAGFLTKHCQANVHRFIYFMMRGYGDLLQCVVMVKDFFYVSCTLSVIPVSPVNPELLTSILVDRDLVGKKLNQGRLFVADELKRCVHKKSTRKIPIQTESYKSKVTISSKAIDQCPFQIVWLLLLLLPPPPPIMSLS